MPLIFQAKCRKLYATLARSARAEIRSFKNKKSYKFKEQKNKRKKRTKRNVLVLDTLKLMITLACDYNLYWRLRRQVSSTLSFRVIDREASPPGHPGWCPRPHPLSSQLLAEYNHHLFTCGAYSTKDAKLFNLVLFSSSHGLFSSTLFKIYLSFPILYYRNPCDLLAKN